MFLTRISNVHRIRDVNQLAEIRTALFACSFAVMNSTTPSSSLDASPHLCKRVCPSVGPLVGNTFFLNWKNEGFFSCMLSERPRNITEM